MPSTRLLVALIVVAIGLTAAGCADDGRTLSAPADWQTTTTRPLPPTSAPDQEIGETGLTLTSPLFQPGDDIPVLATCAGDNVFPDLAWSAVPAEAVELAVTMSDQTDPDSPVLLWLMAGIEPSMNGLIGGELPVGAFETLNDYGNPGYGTPCLDSFTDGRRDIQFRLHVLSQPSGIAPGDPGNEAWSTVKAGSIESASLLSHIESQA